jgi:polyphosphate kinase
VRVHSLLGRYLEHARVYAFGHGPESGEPQTQVYIGSADWMSRNLDRRVEVLAPVSDPVHKQGVLDLVAAEWADTRGSWELGADGVYRKLPGDLSAQETFMRSRGAVAD